MPRGNPANLIQNKPGQFTPEQVREWNRKGALVAAATKRRHKAQREILREILSLPCDDPEAVKALQALGLDTNFANAANLAVLKRAAKGDVEALRYVRDTIGEKPADTMAVGVLDKPVKALELNGLSDSELEALADRADSENSEPKALPETPVEL